MPTHSILGGEVRLYRRDASKNWHCATYINGREWRKSTKEDSLDHAKEIAEGWYLELRGKLRAGVLKPPEQSFREAAKVFEDEYAVITAGERSLQWTEGHKIRLRLHLIPFFGSKGISEINGGTWQEYHVHRNTSSRTGKPPARSTMHDELVTLRMVLKSAVRHGKLARLPDLSMPYRQRTKVVHRPWFSPEEYKQLYKASREYTETCPARHRWSAEQVHDFILFLANTGLRPDEAREHNLQHRDIKIVFDKATQQKILEIEVRGKRGLGYCKSMSGAVVPYQRLRNRPKPQPKTEEEPNPSDRFPEPTDPVFPGNHIKLFNGILRRAKLKFDRDGKPRTAYSLRHTYICMRLMEGADIYQIAKNCRTSVEMIEEHYAKHLKDVLDAAAINVRKASRRSREAEPVAPKDTPRGAQRRTPKR